MSRFDPAVRVVMWLDAVLSVAIVVVGVLAAPLLAVFGVPDGLRAVLGVAAFVWAVLLALCGACYATLLMLRMSNGDVLLPARLWLPLPDPLRPPEYRRTRPARGGVSSAGARRAGDRAGR